MRLLSELSFVLLNMLLYVSLEFITSACFWINQIETQTWQHSYGHMPFDTPPNVGSCLDPPRLSTSLLVINAEYKKKKRKRHGSMVSSLPQIG